MDLHPEELLDAEEEGTLSGPQLERLNAHCRVCATCTVLRAARADFASALMPSERDEALAFAAVASFQQGTRLAPSSSTRSAKRSWGVMRIAAALAVMAIAGTAGAVGLAKLGIIHITALSEPAPATAPVVPRKAAARATVPVNPEAESPEPSLEPAVEPESATRAPRNKPVAPRSGVSVGDLFASANQARRSGNNRDAVRLYDELIHQFPASEEASQAQVSLGSLLLHMNSTPARALQQFDAYLVRNPRGPLAEEARAGRAMTLGRLGRTALERQAWQDILERHPGSIHADKARRRLEELR